MSRADLASPAPLDPTADEIVEPAYVVESGGTRLNPWLLPPLFLIVVSIGLITWRVSTPDWHWAPRPSPARELAEAAPPTATEPSAEVAVEVEPEPAPELAQADDPEPVETQAEETIAKAEPDPSSLSDIEAEAARLKAEREELERLKREEGERIAQAPPARSPFMPFGFGFGFGLQQADPQDMARLQEQLQRLAEAQMAEAQRRLRRFEAEARRGVWDMPRPRDFGPPGDDLFAMHEQAFRQFQRDLDRQMQQMDRRMRQMDALMRQMERGFAMPPVPGAPLGFGPGLDDEADPEPRIERFDLVTPDGRRIGFTFRQEFRRGF